MKIDGAPKTKPPGVFYTPAIHQRVKKENTKAKSEKHYDANKLAVACPGFKSKLQLWTIRHLLNFPLY
ncbi:hypothetical protein T10_9217 [Trichinella papuae]|uniref:Uncharacterized protein n=1 Tax=Trichinella papuae TaxID=268474 RepID=A0A0V1M470_9BILA|nr:hypothetical protein T10_9217 [Trichinella papuae]